MKQVLKGLLAIAVMSAVLPAQAAVHNYNFNGEIDSGFYQNELLNGSFSFDDAGITSVGTEFFDVTTLNMSFLNTTFTQANFDVDAPAATFEDGVFSGLTWDFTSASPDVAFSLISGFSDASDAFIAYDTGLGTSGEGSLNFTAVTAVPEPQTYAMFLAGLGLLGFASRRKA